MRIVFGKDDAKKIPPARRVVTVGMFDGVHLGHQKTISTAVGLARDPGSESAVLTFDRHPESVLSGKVPMQITSLRHRLSLFERLGPGLCVVLHFDRELAATSARDFLEKILAAMLGAKAVVLGENATFGKGGEGNFDFLKAVAPEYGIEAHQVSLVRMGGQIVSSTAVRAAITKGNLKAAQAMLGRQVSLLGTVVHGDEMGGKIGYPTANLDLHHEARPPRGVYAASVQVGDMQYDAVMNIGIRPTVENKGEERVEVHLIGFEGNLRGMDLEVRLRKRLRNEIHFSTLEELARQIKKDCEAVRVLARSEKELDTGRGVKVWGGSVE